MVKRFGIVAVALAALVGVGLLSVMSAKAFSNQNTNSSTGQNTSGNANSGGHSNMNHGSHQGHSNMNGGQMNSNMGGGGSMALSSSDRRFVMEAAMGGMEEVTLGRLAAERGGSAEVKQFGQRMVDDHTRANEQLMQLASSKGITPPTALNAKQQADVTRLSAMSGAQFDREYTRQMLKDHKKDVSMFQKQSTRGQDADLKAFASQTLPTLQEHLRMVQGMSDAMKGGSRMNSNGSRGGGNMNSNSNSNM